MFSGMPSSSSEILMDTGSVAAEEEVEMATNRAGKILRTNRMGLILASRAVTKG